MARRGVALLLAATLGFWPGVSGSSSPARQTQTPPPHVALRPAADAFVSRARPAANFGHLPRLRVDASPALRTYLKLRAPRSAAGAATVTLRLFAVHGSNRGGEAYRVHTSSWREGTINWSDRPSLGSAIGPVGPVSAGDFVSIDVTAAMHGAGTYTFALVTWAK